MGRREIKNGTDEHGPQGDQGCPPKFNHRLDPPYAAGNLANTVPADEKYKLLIANKIERHGRTRTSAR
jgi:hypothetical protein